MNVAELRRSGLVLFEVISGSKAYGINKPTSDTDIRGVYLAPFDDVLGFKCKDQIADDTNDIVFYELKRFLDLIEKQNPNILEMLYMPEDCILYKNPLMDKIFEHKDKFLSKTCMHSFAGYAISQIKKAKGLNKKINKPMSMVRKTPLDFCYFMHEGKSVNAREYLAEYGKLQQHCGLVCLDHMRFTYAVYYDQVSHLNAKGKNIPLSYKPFRGIITSEETSNDVCLSEIPKGWEPMGYMVFNRDAYEVHCKDYKEYLDWIEKRNPDRYEVTISNGNDYDAKNMAHCIRLIRVAKEIASEGVVNVRRADREELLNIRNGQAKYEELINEADEALSQLGNLYAASNLIDQVDKVFMNKLLLELRKTAYGL